MSENLSVNKNEAPMWQRKGFSSEAEYEKSKAQQLIRISDKLIKRAEKAGVLSSIPYEADDISITHHQTANKFDSGTRKESTHSTGVHKRGNSISAGVSKRVIEHPSEGGVTQTDLNVYTDEEGSKLLGTIKKPNYPSLKKEQTSLTLDQSVTAAAKMLNSIRSDIATAEIEQKYEKNSKGEDVKKNLNDLLNA